MGNDLKTISFLVGNGFDIAILKALKSKHTTTYAEFYDYINWNKSDNNEFCKSINENISDWSDFEKALTKKINEQIKKLYSVSFEQADLAYKKLIRDWDEIQLLFSDFLNEVIPPILLKKAGNINGMNSKTMFLGDLSREDLKKLRFRVKQHDFLEYNVVNFNYSTLLDNYLTADEDPFPYSTSKNNLILKWPDVTKFREIFTRSKTRVFHPHGLLSIPSSIKFGNSENEIRYKASEVMQNQIQYRPEKLRKKLNKAYWYQNNPEMKTFIEKTDLFVIYGLGIGETDRWWWELVAKNIVDNQSEAIIYSYKTEEQEQNVSEKLEGYVVNYIRNKVSQDGKINGFLIEDFVTLSKNKISVIEFDDTNKLKYGFNFD